LQNSSDHHRKKMNGLATRICAPAEDGWLRFVPQKYFAKVLE